jgi:hypothetical protein
MLYHVCRWFFNSDGGRALRISVANDDDDADRRAGVTLTPAAPGVYWSWPRTSKLQTSPVNSEGNRIVFKEGLWLMLHAASTKRLELDVELQSPRGALVKSLQMAANETRGVFVKLPFDNDHFNSRTITAIRLLLNEPRENDALVVNYVDFKEKFEFEPANP